MDEKAKLIDEIRELKQQKKATILVHYYQIQPIHQIADFIGDSYGLAKQATTVDADIIVFCGVDFMAESAYILNPDKTVLIPSRAAKCPMAAKADAESVSKRRLQSKDHN